MKKFDNIEKISVYFLSLIIIVIGFQICYGFEIVNPKNINWLMSAYHDWGQHYLGWAYFRSEPWQFPLGHISNFNYPIGATVGYTDSIPLLALFFKSFSFLLSEPFQYLGLWLLICHLLMGFYTIKILELFNVKVAYILIAVFFVALNPMLLFRGLHPALCGHWLILASLYFYLSKATPENVKNLNIKQIIILVLSALINPYFIVLVVGFNLILPFKNYFYDKLISLKQAFFYFSTALILVLFAWFLTGMISFQNEVNMQVIDSYGLYGANLNAFINSSGFSSFLSEMPYARPQQYEGYAYLGLGMMVLFCIAVSYVIMNYFLKKNLLKNRALLPLFVLAFFITLFAITHLVTYNDKTLIEIPVLDIIKKVGGVFRASGRFIWLIYYLIFFFSIIVFIKIKVSDAVKFPVFALLLAFQIYDTKPIMLFRDLPSGNYEIKKISEKKWTLITSKFKRIISYPPFENNLSYQLDYQDFCFIALKNKIPITSGYVARESGDLNKKFKDSLKMDLDVAVIEDNDLYITTSKYLEDFNSLLLKKKVQLRYLDGFYYLYSTKSKNKITLKPTREETNKIDSIYNEIKGSNKISTITRPSFLKDKIAYNVETNNFNNGILQLKGWAHLANTTNNKYDSIYLVLTNKENTFISKTKSFLREDVTAAYKKGNVDNSGFSVRLFTDGLSGKNYNIAIGIKDKNKVWTYQILDQIPTINLDKQTPPKLINQLPISTSKTIGNIDQSEVQSGNVFIGGWATIENGDTTNSSHKVYLINGKIIYEIETEKVNRQDVTNSYKGKFKYTESGFKLTVSKSHFKPGKYTIAVLFTDKNNNKGLFTYNNKINIP